MRKTIPHLLSLRSRPAHRRQSGQALIEFVFVALMMIVLFFGLIDFGRAIYEKQVLINISREGSNLASRAVSLSNTVAAVTNSATPLTFSTKGRVIVTSVVNSNGVFLITDQASGGGITAISKIGTQIGGKAKLPVTSVPIPQLNQTVYVTEVFYSFKPITPVGRLIGFAMPSQLYDVAYF